jgi:ribosomal protein S18 acetylase RimI-like enzyme
VTPDITLRTATPADYDPIIAVVDDWWGRPIRHALPRVFLDHFYATSTIAEADGALAGFLVAFLSPSEPDEAYIHFVGVNPDRRGQGLARVLYERFFEVAAADGRKIVHAITAAVNTRSIAFHTAMGFSVTDPIPNYDGDPVPKVIFTRPLAPAR